MYIIFLDFVYMYKKCDSVQSLFYSVVLARLHSARWSRKVRKSGNERVDEGGVDRGDRISLKIEWSTVRRKFLTSFNRRPPTRLSSLCHAPSSAEPFPAAVFLLPILLSFSHRSEAE